MCHFSTGDHTDDDDNDVGRDKELLTVCCMMMWSWFTRHALPVLIKLTLSSILTNSYILLVKSSRSNLRLSVFNEGVMMKAHHELPATVT